MKPQFKKFLAWVFIIYFSIGFAFAGGYLHNEYKTFECSQANGTATVIFLGNGNFQNNLDGCSRRIYSAYTLLTAGFLFVFWLPAVSLKAVNSLQ